MSAQCVPSLPLWIHSTHIHTKTHKKNMCTCKWGPGRPIGISELKVLILVLTGAFTWNSHITKLISWFLNLISWFLNASYGVRQSAEVYTITSMAGKLRVMLKSDDFSSYKASFLIKSAYFTLPSRRLRCNYLSRLGNMMTDMVGKKWMPSRWKIESHADLYAIKSADFTIPSHWLGCTYLSRLSNIMMTGMVGK